MNECYFITFECLLNLEERMFERFAIVYTSIGTIC